MSAVVPAKSRGGASGSAREEAFGVEEVEAGIAALSDRVARLQKDIGAVKRADDGPAGSHRGTRTRPTKMTYARNVDDRPREEKVARFAKGTRGGDEDRREGESGESKSRSHELTADPREAASSRRAPTTAAPTTTTRQRKPASQKENDGAGERKAGQDAPKAQPSTRRKKAEDSGNGSAKIKSRKVGEKDQDAKARTATNSEISSKIIKLSKATAKKIKPDKKKFHSVFKKAPDESKQKSSKINFMKSSKSNTHDNENHKSHKQNTRKNSKSSDSIEPKRIVIRDKLSHCTKELNQLLRKVSGLFRKKSSNI